MLYCNRIGECLGLRCLFICHILYKHLRKCILCNDLYMLSIGHLYQGRNLPYKIHKYLIQPNNLHIWNRHMTSKDLRLLCHLFQGETHCCSSYKHFGSCIFHKCLLKKKDRNLNMCLGLVRRNIRFRSYRICRGLLCCSCCNLLFSSLYKLLQKQGLGQVDILFQEAYRSVLWKVQRVTKHKN